MSIKKVVLGIDMGTSKTCAAAFHNNSIQTVEFGGDRQLTNYMTCQGEAVTREYGELARSKTRTNYKYAVYDPKIFLATDSSHATTYNWLKLPFEVKAKEAVTNENDQESKLYIRQNGVLFSPESLEAVFLGRIKEFSEKFFDKSPIREAVICVPAGFTDSQRQATKDAARIAGFKDESVCLLNDTTAAARALAHEKQFADRKLVLVFDLGAFYLNLSLVKIEYGAVEVQAAASHPEMGGKSIDHSMLRHILASDYARQMDLLQQDNTKIEQTLLLQCEKAKKTLSNGPEAVIEVESLKNDTDFEYKFTRDEFEKINANLFESILEKVENLLKTAKRKSTDIDEIVMLGGGSRIPKVHAMLQSFFGGKKLNFSMNASETVANGAALHSAFAYGFKLKNPNGFPVRDISQSVYRLEIQLKDAARTFLRLELSSSLPDKQTIYIKNSAFKLTYSLRLFENGIIIFEVDLEAPECSFEIGVWQDVNSVVGIEINGKCLLAFGRKKKRNCLSSDEIESEIKNYLRLQESELKHTKLLKRRHELELRCYSLKKISKPNGQLQKDIDAILKTVKTESDIMTADTILTELENLHRQSGF